MKKIILLILVLCTVIPCNLFGQDLKTLEKQTISLNLATKLNELKIKLVKLDTELLEVKEKAEKAKLNSLKAVSKLVNNSNDEKDNKLVGKSADATKESQKIQGSINKLNDKITSVKEKITDIENKMSKQSWGVQLVPQN
jgi:uncharacterized phage infection (PIP) family protein YhgE